MKAFYFLVTAIEMPSEKVEYSVGLASNITDVCFPGKV